VAWIDLRDCMYTARRPHAGRAARLTRPRRLLRRLGQELPLVGDGHAGRSSFLLAVPGEVVRTEVVGPLGRRLPARRDGAALACKRQTSNMLGSLPLLLLRSMARPPPPWAQQRPRETAILEQPSFLQRVPPPCDQQMPRDLARLAQPSTLQMV
jgi:hypothetical protein